VAISGDSEVVATAETEGTSKFTITIRYPNGNVKRTLNCEGIVRAIALNLDGNLLASAEATKSNQTVLKLWNATTGAIKWRISSPASINHLAFSHNASMVASAENGQIRIWDQSTGLLKLTLPEEPHDTISSLIFSNAGKLLVSAGLPSGVIKLWNISSGRLDHALENEGPVGALAFSHDDRLLASADGKKGSIKVWAKRKDGKMMER
jgi:WD40 repeat protein